MLYCNCFRNLVCAAALLTAASAGARVKPGVEVLRDGGFEMLEGLRVGLVTNPSGVDSRLNSTIDILAAADNVELVALYAPEHGVRGDIYAGGRVESGVDERTGLPVHSLYGATRQPTAEMLDGVDIRKMKQFLDLPSDQQDANLPKLGIPTDSTNNQFKEWVKIAREQNRDLRIAIKADQTTPYAQIKTIMTSLQDIRENRYNLITSLKAASSDM